MVTNGCIAEEPLNELLKYIDAFNVDLKSFRTPVYENVLGGKLDTVLSTISTIEHSNAWLEITTLIVLLI